MAAPYGNRNGEKSWYTPISENEKSVVAQTRIPESMRQELEGLLREGESMAQFYREAITAAVAKRKAPEQFRIEEQVGG
ncbi:MAG: hypothetical protein WBA13_09725 [Microcoleaceae cyanobacterium]